MVSDYEKTRKKLKKMKNAQDVISARRLQALIHKESQGRIA
jgi:hypothetical protein